MGKIKRKPKKNRGKIRTGDVFQVVTDVSLEDVDEDGFDDLTVEHVAYRNRTKFVQSSTTWFGLDADAAAEFEAALVTEGIEDETVEFSRFKDLVHYWKKFTRALERINRFGDKFAAEYLGE